MRSRSVPGTPAMRPYSRQVPDPGPASPDPARPPVRVVELDWRSVALVLAAFATLAGATAVVRAAPRTLTALAVGTMLALALNPLVGAVERRARVRRGVAVGLVLAGFLVAVVLLALGLGPPAVREARDIQRDLPRVVRQLNDLPVVGDDLREARAAERIQDWVEELPRRLAGDTTPIVRAGQAVISGALSGALVLLVAVTLLLDGHRLVAAARRLVPPDRRTQADRIGALAYAVVGRYVAGSLFVAGVAFVAVLVAGLALSVPLTPLVAVWVMVFDLVPQIGGAVGGIPFVLLGFAHSAPTGVACAVFFVLYLQVENHVIQPLVVGRTVRLSPPATMTAALVGVSAAGVVGALVVVPLVGAVKVAWAELHPKSPEGPDGVERGV